MNSKKMPAKKSNKRSKLTTEELGILATIACNPSLYNDAMYNNMSATAAELTYYLVDHGMQLSKSEDAKLYPYAIQFNQYMERIGLSTYQIDILEERVTIEKPKKSKQTTRKWTSIERLCEHYIDAIADDESDSADLLLTEIAREALTLVYPKYDEYVDTMAHFASKDMENDY